MCLSHILKSFYAQVYLIGYTFKVFLLMSNYNKRTILKTRIYNFNLLSFKKYNKTVKYLHYIRQFQKRKKFTGPHRNIKDTPPTTLSIMPVIYLVHDRLDLAII